MRRGDDADADPERNPARRPANCDGFGKAGDNAARERSDAVAQFNPGGDDRELVTADTRQRRIADLRQQRSTDGEKRAISHVMAVRVVDGLEPIEIQHQHGGLVVRPETLQGLL